MANVGSTTVQNILNTVVFPDFQKAFSNYSGFLGQVPMKAGKGRLQIPMHTAGMNVDAGTAVGGSGTDVNADYSGAFGEGEGIPAGQANTRKTVEWAYKRYGTTVSIDGLTQAQSTAGGLVNLTDLLADEMMLAVDDLKHAITMDALGVGTHSDKDFNIHSIQKIVNDASVIAGIDQASNAYFASEDKVSTAGLVLNEMDDVWDELVSNRLSIPNAIWTSQKQYSAYEGLLNNQARYMSMEKGDARFSAIDYRGVPVIAIPKCVNTEMYFVDTNDFNFYYMPQRSYTSSGKVIEGAFKVEAKDASGKDAVEFTIVAYLALVCRNPYKQGKLSAIQ